MMHYSINNSRWITEWGFTMLSIGYSCLLIAFIYARPQEIVGKCLASPVGRAFAFIGVYSYPIYLWHVDCGKLPLVYLTEHGFLHGMQPSLRYMIVMTIYVVVATLVGIVMGRLVEQPALKLRDRLFPSAASPIKSPTPSGTAARLT